MTAVISQTARRGIPSDQAKWYKRNEGGGELDRELASALTRRLLRLRRSFLFLLDRSPQ